MALEALSAIDFHEQAMPTQHEKTVWKGREVQLPDSDFRLAHLGQLPVHTMFFQETQSRLVLCAREVSAKTSEPKSSTEKGSTREQKSSSESKKAESKQSEPKHSVSLKGSVSKDNYGRDKGKMSTSYKYSHKNEDGSSIDVDVEGSASTDLSDSTKDILSGEINAGVTLRF